jgi:hypothetical protein
MMATVLACGRPDASPSWLESPDSVGFRSITGLTTACSTCIAITPLVTLGTDTVEGFLEDNGAIDYVVRDREGRYWVGQRTMVKVFAPDGSFHRSVGRRGQGPMEFAFAQPVHVDSSGSVHIFDVRMGRETIIGADFSLQSDRTIPVALETMAPLPGDGHRYVVAKWVATENGSVLPLHIVSGSEILTSFGTTRQSGGTDAAGMVLPLLRVTSSGHVFSSKALDYVIEAWNDSGSRIAGFELPNLNGGVIQPGPWTMDNPPGNHVTDIAAYDSHRLWVVTRHRRSNWRELVVERVSQNRIPYIEPKDGLVTSVYRSRIDVVDLNESAIVASSWHDGVLLRFVEPGVISRLDHDENGNPLLRVLRVTWQPQ